MIFSGRNSDVNLVELDGLVKEDDRAVLLEGGGLQSSSPRARISSTTSNITRSVRQLEMNWFEYVYSGPGLTFSLPGFLCWMSHSYWRIGQLWGLCKWSCFNSHPLCQSMGNCVSASNLLLTHLCSSEFGALLIYFYICDRTNFLGESKKVVPYY